MHGNLAVTSRPENEDEDLARVILQRYEEYRGKARALEPALASLGVAVENSDVRYVNMESADIILDILKRAGKSLTKDDIRRAMAHGGAFINAKKPDSRLTKGLATLQAEGVTRESGEYVLLARQERPEKKQQGKKKGR